MLVTRVNRSSQPVRAGRNNDDLPNAQDSANHLDEKRTLRRYYDRGRVERRSKQNAARETDDREENDQSRVAHGQAEHEPLTILPAQLINDLLLLANCVKRRLIVA